MHDAAMAGRAAPTRGVRARRPAARRPRAGAARRRPPPRRPRAAARTPSRRGGALRRAVSRGGRGGVGRGHGSLHQLAGPVGEAASPRPRGRRRGAAGGARRSWRPPSFDLLLSASRRILSSTPRSAASRVRARCSRMLTALGVVPRTTAISAGVRSSHAQSRRSPGPAPASRRARRGGRVGQLRLGERLPWGQPRHPVEESPHAVARHASRWRRSCARRRSTTRLLRLRWDVVEPAPEDHEHLGQGVVGGIRPEPSHGVAPQRLADEVDERLEPGPTLLPYRPHDMCPAPCRVFHPASPSGARLRRLSRPRSAARAPRPAPATASGSRPPRRARSPGPPRRR